ncbi:hypothetical protein Van01_40120 [Micromonospora andamanensis]|uniref:Interferon-induced transmembrane protein n=2 Tax=Micromonospora andamanensis TaxID=1287068 RepID=A0ABQ4HYP7_9ACTN|nr:hypothetical protein Van01_40120 [Micromonospora andamanensis]
MLPEPETRTTIRADWVTGTPYPAGGRCPSAGQRGVAHLPDWPGPGTLPVAWDRRVSGPHPSAHNREEHVVMQPDYPSQPPQPVDNNMTMSIVAIFLFWPLAIPAIINASKVNPLLQQGDYAGAQAAAAESKKWSKWALIVGIAWLAIVLVCCLGGGLLGSMSGSNASGY